MAFRYIVFCAFVAAASAGVITAPAATSYASSSVLSHGYGVGRVAYAAPAVAAVHAAPVVHTAVHAAPVVHAAVHAAPVVQHYAAPVAAPVLAKTVVAEQYAPAHYNFEYSVQDPHTGDVKSQSEVREGDVVHGSYSLIEADGTKRVVEYTADEHNGFNAVVHREPAAHPVAVKAVAPVAVAPVVKTLAAAPVLRTVAAAPALSYYHH